MTESLPPQARDFDVRMYLRVLLSYKWLILACTIIVGAGTTAWTMRQPRVFEAKTTIEFDPNPTGPLGSEVEDVADPVGRFWSTREFMATQHRVLASRSVAERVVRRLGLHEDPEFLGVPAAGFEARDVTSTAGMLLDALTVAPVKDTRIVEIRLRGRDPEQVAAIADAFADVFIEKTLEDRMGSTVGALEWLGNQLDTLRQELESSELALHEFKESHNVLSVSMEDRQNLVAKEIESFNEALTAARQRRIELAARVSRLQSALNDDPLEASGTVFDQRSALQELREALRTKLAEKERLSVRYGVSHPQILAINQEIAALREQLGNEVQTIVENARADLQEIRSVEGGLRSATEQAQAAGLELNLREIEYQRLNRERENKAKLYELVLARTTETDLTRMVQTTPVRIVDRALVPRWPVAPNRTANALAGILAGLLLGIGLAVGLRRLDRRLRSPDMVEELGLTVVGVIPQVTVPEDDSGKAADLVVHSQPMSTASECVRTVRTNLMFMSIGTSESSVFAVTSSHPQEGKTTVACNLAASMAQSGKRVALVDTDLRRARIHHSFGLRRDVGVSTFVAGEAAFTALPQESHVPGLDVITAGPLPPNPAELLHHPRFSELVEQLRSAYDVVIFDSPPLGAVTDAAILGPQVDGVLLVVRATATTRDALLSSLRQLRDVGARVLGGIVNAFDFQAEGYYDKGYYYRGYGYYASDDELESAAE